MSAKIRQIIGDVKSLASVLKKNGLDLTLDFVSQEDKVLERIIKFQQEANLNYRGSSLFYTLFFSVFYIIEFGSNTMTLNQS